MVQLDSLESVQLKLVWLRYGENYLNQPIQDTSWLDINRSSVETRHLLMSITAGKGQYDQKESARLILKFINFETIHVQV